MSQDDAVERLFRSAVKDGDMDYDALRSDDLDQALAAVADADLDGMERDDAYAFLINAYNICVLDAARRRRLGNGRDLNNPILWLWFFLLTPVKVAGRTVNLYWLEAHHIKPHMRRDPRGHFALVCASSGCPPLRDGLFHGAELDQELEAAGKAFMQPGGGYRLDKDAGVLWLNRILKWYKKDFRTIGTPQQVMMRYAPDDDAAWVQENDPRAHFMSYDWSLNQAD